MIGNLTKNGAKLKRIFIEPKLPEGLNPLYDLAHNLWWSWNHEATALYREINEVRFEALNFNPIALLDEMSTERAQELLANKDFVKRMKAVHADFQKYMTTPKPKKDAQIGYFCMEYGLHQSMRLYSGGLGILAGDYLKEASDRNINMVCVGLLYRYGYFNQGISLHGEQIHGYEPSKFTQLPLHPVRDSAGDWLKIHVNLKGNTIWAKLWELKVGRISLYLMDTDIDDNRWEDRTISHQLYGGDNENRLRQELLLGVGGLRALKAMQVQPDIFHLNEGHASFLSLERLSTLMSEQGLSFREAMEIVRASQLFTTHTPVPAGHDAFSEQLLKEYMMEFCYSLDLTWVDFMAMGRGLQNLPGELFSVSNLSFRCCQYVNGVSKLHGEVSQEMFNELYPEFSKEELFIGYVTNSVHFPTWVAAEWLELYEKTFGKDFLDNQINLKYWEKIHKVADSTIMDIRVKLKKRLLDWVRTGLHKDLIRRGENPRTVFQIVNGIPDNALVIGFARRFATYKRATLLFSNEDRLAEIVGNTDRPIIFLFAGKAHPADGGGQGFIREVYNFTKRPEFKGRVIFLENYSMEMAKLLVQGVDIWLNNPERPKEASGTSGMKAVMNGVMNFSVLDGWWCEGYKEGAGWALPEKNTYEEKSLQNELDAETIYNMLENEILPTYYDRDASGVSKTWVAHIKNTIAQIAPVFVMGRMLDDYYERYYSKLAAQVALLRGRQYETAKELAAWKQKVRAAWHKIHVTEMQVPDTFNHSLALGEGFDAEISLNLMDLKGAEIGVEVVFFRRVTETDMELVDCQELVCASPNAHQAKYSCHILPRNAGVFEYGFRLFPKHNLLVHRQDFGLVKWL